MRTKLTLLSPAKLNLFLHITGQRSDGYHLLQSVFQLIDLSDELSFEANDSGEILLDSNLNFPQEDNIIFKAAKQLQAHAPDKGCTIHLKKNIPMGGGLGGGSSNAATTLLALNQLWEIHLPKHTLLEYGLALGADVPFFVEGQNAWVEGVGENIFPIKINPQYYVVIVPKTTEIATQKIFANKQLTRDTKVIKIREFHQGMGHNDCEPIVCERFPKVAEAIKDLSQFAPARMSGTGASVFASFKSLDKAQAARQALDRKYRAYLCKGLTESPLHKKIVNISN